MGGRCAVAAAVTVWGALLAGSAPGVPPATWLALLPPVAWLALRAPPRVGTVLALLALALAGLARGGASWRALEHEAAGLAEGLAPRWIRARMVEHPMREADAPLAIARLLERAGPLPPGTRLRLRLPPDCGAEWGDTLIALATLERPAERSNPGGFAPREAARALAIAAQGRVLAARVAPARGVHAWPRATAVRWRRAAERVLARGLGVESRQLVTPLVIGDRTGLPPALGADLRASGLTHLLALSGLHVVWLAAVVRTLVAALGAGVRGRALAGGACALGYALIAGPLPSLMRAAATECLGAGARLAGRALDPVQALALSALVLLGAAPGWAGDLGFQLSCAATLGLVTVGPWLSARAGRWRVVCAPFNPTIAAQAIALPLLIDRFHALPWTALLSNVLAVPVSGALLAAAWLAIGWESLLPGAGAWFLAACEVLSGALRGIAGAAGRLPGALIATGCDRGPAWLGGAGALLLVLGLRLPRTLADQARPISRGRLAALLFGTPASGLALLLALTAPALRPPAGHWWLVVLDVGQGDAVALAFPDGWWLVDAGPRTPRFDAGESTVLPFLRWAGVRRLERMILTHDDGDHTGGAHAVLRGAPPGAIVVPAPAPGAPGPAARFARAGCPLVHAARGDTLRRAPGAAVLWPPAGEPQLGDNAGSLVLAVAGEGGGPATALLAADVDSTVEARCEVVSPVAVLKVAHHGSGSSSGERFLARARPAIAVVSCGRRNAFGHPDPGALSRLAAAGASVARTDREGAVWLEVSASGVRRIDWRRGPPRGSPVARAAARPVADAGPRW